MPAGGAACAARDAAAGTHTHSRHLDVELLHEQGLAEALGDALVQVNVLQGGTRRGGHMGGGGGAYGAAGAHGWLGKAQGAVKGAALCFPPPPPFPRGTRGSTAATGWQEGTCMHLGSCLPAWARACTYAHDHGGPRRLHAPPPPLRPAPRQPSSPSHRRPTARRPPSWPSLPTHPRPPGLPPSLQHTHPLTRPPTCLK